MLRQVITDLFDFHRKERQKRLPRKKSNEVIREIRMRIYKILKNLIRQKFQKGVCEDETVSKLHWLVDISKDDPDRPINCFGVYTETFVSVFSESWSIRLSKLPLVGKFLYRVLVDKIYLRYDLLLTVISALSEMVKSEQFLKQQFRDYQVVLDELKSELKRFKELHPKLMKNDEQLISVVQTKKVATTLLNFAFGLIEKLLYSGEIDHNEKQKLYKKLGSVRCKLKKVIFYVNKYSVKGKARKTLRNLRARKSVHEDLASVDVALFKLKMTAVFPFFRELRDQDFQRLQARMSNHSLPKHSKQIALGGLPLSQDERDVFLIKYGLVEIKSDSERMVDYLCKGDVFGSFQLIADDVRMKAQSKCSSRVHRVSLAFMRDLMERYPRLQKQLYSKAIYNYLKCFPSKGLATKSKYFRKLRRISRPYLLKMLDKGKVLSFSNKTEFVKFIYYFQYSTVGIFILDGTIGLRGDDSLSVPIKRLFQMKTTQLLQEFQDIEANRLLTPSKANQKFFSTKNNSLGRPKLSKTRTDECLEKNGGFARYSNGDAVELLCYLNPEFEILSEKLLLFLIDYKILGQKNLKLELYSNDEELNRLKEKNSDNASAISRNPQVLFDNHNRQ